MKMTTDASDTITLGQLIQGCDRELQKQLEAAQNRGERADLRTADQILEKRLKLSKQAQAVGFVLSGDRKPQSELEEIREIIRRYKQRSGK